MADKAQMIIAMKEEIKKNQEFYTLEFHPKS